MSAVTVLEAPMAMSPKDIARRLGLERDVWEQSPRVSLTDWALHVAEVCEGADMRAVLAYDIADQVNCEVLDERCPDCKAPLFMRADQGLPFCWFCVTDRQNALRGRALLLKAKIASLGEPTIYEPPPAPPSDDGEGPRGPFRSGMPL